MPKKGKKPDFTSGFSYFRFYFLTKEFSIDQYSSANDNAKINKNEEYFCKSFHFASRKVDKNFRLLSGLLRFVIARGNRGDVYSAVTRKPDNIITQLDYN